MIIFPKTIEDSAGHEGEIRAGGTDLHEVRRFHRTSDDIVDLRDVSGMDAIKWLPDGGVRIGAKVTIAQLAADQKFADAYRGLSEAAGGLATPQIREVGTVGGNLLQSNRCWYFRNPHTHCLRKGGDRCLARGGDHLYHAVFDFGPCVAPHASTLGMALLAYEGVAEVAGASGRTVGALYGDGTDPRRDHMLEPGAVLTAVVIPPPKPGEQSAYFRAISRARSEWPLVEVLARVLVEGGSIRRATVSVGGVANIPLRLPKVEAALLGKQYGPDVVQAAARMAKEGTEPLPMNGYKVDILQAAVADGLMRAGKAKGAAPTRPSVPTDGPSDGPPDAKADAKPAAGKAKPETKASAKPPRPDTKTKASPPWPGKGKSGKKPAKKGDR